MSTVLDPSVSAWICAVLVAETMQNIWTALVLVAGLVFSLLVFLHLWLVLTADQGRGSVVSKLLLIVCSGVSP